MLAVVGGARSAITTRACSVVVPVPRFFGRSQAGERSMRNRRPDRRRLEHHPRRASAAAWSERSRLAMAGHRGRRRRARSRPRRGRWSCRLPWPGEQEQPGVGEVVEVDATVRRTGRSAATCSWCSRISRHRRQRDGREVGVLAADVEASRSSAASPAWRRRRARGHEVERDVVVAAARARGRGAAARRRRSARTAGPACGGSAAQPLHGPQRARSSVSVACTQASSCAVSVGSASRSSSVPASRASRRGTGASTKSRGAKPLASRSTSHEPLTWSASEKE